MKKETKYPPALLKACEDYFDYALCTITGEVFEFSQAKICGDWVHLELKERPRGKGFCFERGIDIALAHIVWVADAPEGS